MAVTVTRAYNPPETIDYDPKAREVTVVRPYEVRGAYPENILTLGRDYTIPAPVPAVYTNELPAAIVMDVYGDGHVILGAQDAYIVSVTCFMASVNVAASVAPSAEASASTIVTVTYKGYIPGVTDHDLDISTESVLQKVDLDPAHVDAEGRPRSIGAKGEGVNKHSPKGEWHIGQICAYTGPGKNWHDLWAKIAVLTGTVNELGWRPIITGAAIDGTNDAAQWTEGMWLYLGATIGTLVGPYFKLTHTFLPSLTAPESTTMAYPHRHRWAEETQIEGDAETAEGATGKRLKISFGPEQTSMIYPIAGQGADPLGAPGENKNAIVGRDLRTHLFSDLGL